MCSTMHMLRPCSHHAHTCTVTKQGATEWWSLCLLPGALISSFQWNGMRLGIDISCTNSHTSYTQTHKTHTSHSYNYTYTYTHTHTENLIYTFTHTHAYTTHSYTQQIYACNTFMHTHTLHTCVSTAPLSYTLHVLVLNKEGWSRTKTLALRRFTSKR